MEHYYILNSKSQHRFDEVSESEFFSLVGNKEIRPYADKVYKGDISIEEVPENLRFDVESVVANKVARLGVYEDGEIDSSELKTMIEEVI